MAGEISVNTYAGSEEADAANSDLISSNLYANVSDKTEKVKCKSNFIIEIEGNLDQAETIEILGEVVTSDDNTRQNPIEDPPAPHSGSNTQAVESSSIDQLSPQDDDEEPSKDSIMAGKSLEETEDKSAEAKTIFVGNLSRELDSDDLKTLFQRYGKIVEFIRHEKKKTKEDILYSPFAIITMEKKSEVERAIQELNGLFLDGKAIVVQKAVSKEAKRAAGLPSWRDGQSKTETHRPRKRALEEQFRCDDCNIDLYSQVRFDSHMAGKKHANKVGKGNNSSTFSDTESGSKLRCDICNINFSTFSRTDYGAKSRLDGHLAGKKHAKMVSNLDGAR